jgi:hypothetical protein
MQFYFYSEAQKKYRYNLTHMAYTIDITYHNHKDHKLQSLWHDS